MKEVNRILTKITGVSMEYIVVADTDSIYFRAEKLVEQKCKGMNDQEIVTFLEKFVVDVLQPVMNKTLAEIAKKFGIDDCRIWYKLECIGPTIITLAKKKYAFDILYSEGVRYKEPKMKVMGIEIVRSSTPAIVKDYLKDCLALCLRSEESALQDKVCDVKTMFMKQPYTSISFPRGVNGMTTYTSLTSIYQKGNGVTTPIHVRAALLYNHHLEKQGLAQTYQKIGDGDKIKFVYLKMPNKIHENVIGFIDKIPEKFDVIRFIDYNTQWEKTFLAPLKNITDAIGWEVEKKVTLDMGF